MTSMTDDHSTPAPAPIAPARIALVGDRSPGIRSHQRVPALAEALRQRDGLLSDLFWVPTGSVGGPDDLIGFDGVWLLPGSPYRSEAGALQAVRAAREQGIPFLGTCAGFQHALLEYARGVGGLHGAAHAETSPEAEDPLIVPLACSLVGHQAAVDVLRDSLAGRLLGAPRTVERYHCSYGLAAGRVAALQAAGVRFTGRDADGEVRIAELPGHPFFLASLFQPELAGDGTRPHPFVRGFLRAAGRHAARRERAGAAA